MKRFLPLLLLPALAHASIYGSGGVEAVVPGTRDVTHTFTESGTFTLSQAATVRLLVVGGGGGGGVISVDSVVLSAGTYTVTVGAGGAGGTSGNGGIGGATTIADSNGTILYKALGGGGGVGWGGSTPVSSDAAPFASGGGGTNGKSGSTAGDPTQGHNGAKGTSNGPQGGGGAGGPSVGGGNSKGGVGGNGGPGVTNNITGVAQIYGAGGGGGAYGDGNSAFNAQPGTGGDGLGGWGVPEPYGPTTEGVAERSAGRAGFGGGGGGGNNKTATGAPGGSGCAIFRLCGVDPAVAAPTLGGAAFESATPFDAVLSVTLASPGAGAASADVFLQVAADPADVAAAAEIAATAGADGLYRATAAGLRPGQTYSARFVARNAADEEAATPVFSFTTAALAERTIVVPSASGYAGLWQYHTTGSGLSFDFDETSEGLVEAPGAMMASTGSGGNRPRNGKNWTDGNGTTWGWSGRYGYIGYIWMEAGRTYRFYEQIYDSAGVEIDGVAILSNTSSGGASFGAYECSSTGWHAVKIRLGGGSGNLGVFNNWAIGVGWNGDGLPYPWPDLDKTWPNDEWSPLENTGAEAVFVRSTPWRDVAISSYAPGQDGIDFSVALGASDAGATTVWCAWGDTYGGTDTNAWDHVAPVDSGAAFDATAQTASHTLAGTTGSPLVRFFALHDDGTTAWSGTAKIDLENVSVSDLGVSHDGDEGTFSVRVGGVGSGAFSLTLQVATDSAFASVVTNAAIPAAAAGDYHVTLPLTPGTAYWYRYVATDGSSSDQTPAATFTTAAGVDIADATTTSVTRHFVTFNGTIDDFGAGQTTLVTLWYGDSADALVESENTVTLTTSGPFLFSATIPGATRTVYYKLVASNTAHGGTTWTDETAVASVALNESNVEYTWIGGAEGDWENPANWRSNVATNDCNGWPAMGYVSAKFPAGTVATVHVHGYYQVRPVLNTTGSSVTLVGEGQGTGFSYGDVSGGAMNGTTFSFENMHVSESDIWDYQIGAPTSTNSVLRIAAGATVSQGGNKQAILGTNSCFVVESGAVQNCTFLLLLRSYGEGLRIDDGVCRLGSLCVATPAAGVCPQSLRIAGAGGLLEVKNGVFGDLVGQADHKSEWFKTDLPLLGDFDVVFEPVGGGYTNVLAVASGGETTASTVAMYSTKDNGPEFGTMNVAGSVGKIRIVVDTASMRRAIKSAHGHLVLWRSGIDADHVELVQGDGYTLSYTYGWPSVLAEPENEGDPPTGVWADVSAQASTMLLIK